MATHNIHHYIDEDGLIISASQARIIERRKEVAKLFKEMSPKYRDYTTLYYDIAVHMTKRGFPCNFNTVRNDLRQMGIIFNTSSSRMSHSCKEE